MGKVEDTLEQVANLLARWKARLPEYEHPLKYAKDLDPYVAQRNLYDRFKLCIDELEEVLTSKSPSRE